MTKPLPKLAAPARRALHSIGVATLDDLAKHSETEIAALHGMGPNAMKSLRAAMSEAALRFKKPA